MDYKYKKNQEKRIIYDIDLEELYLENDNYFG